MRTTDENGIRCGNAILAEPKKRTSVACPQQLLDFIVYENGRQIGCLHLRKPSIRFCETNSKPGSVFYIRACNKLVYWKEYGKEPVFMRGFEINNWGRKPNPRALIDYDNHTPREMTLAYDILAEQMEREYANSQQP